MVMTSAVVQSLDVALFAQNSFINIIDATDEKLVIGVSTPEEAAAIPDNIAGFMVDKIIFPRMKAFPCTTCTQGYRMTCDTSRVNQVRPVCGGISVGHYSVTAGSVGCIVQDSAGKKYILSNNHVLARGSTLQRQKANVGDNILQPGSIDGGNSDDVVAKLTRWIQMDEDGNNVADAAIAELISPSVTAWLGGGITLVNQNGSGNPPNTGDTCVKYGRTTGYTENSVLTTTASIPVDYGDATIYFRNQIVFSANQGYENPLCGGDSGSALLNTNGQVVGLCFAGGSESGVEIGVANPIDPILLALAVTIPGGATPPPPICTPGERECREDHLFICSDDGQAWNDNGISSDCQSPIPVCTPGKTKCVGDHIFTCGEDGMTWDDHGISSDCQSIVPPGNIWDKAWIMLPAAFFLGIMMTPKKKSRKK